MMRVIDELAKSGVLSADLRAEAHKVRKKRNEWIHGMAVADYDDARVAVRLSARLLNDVVGLQLRLEPVVGVSGL